MATRRRTPSQVDLEQAEVQAQIEILKKAVGKPNAKWVTIGAALIALAGTPTGLQVLERFRAPPTPAAPMTAIEWDALEDRVDRIESKADTKAAVDEANNKALARELEHIRNALDRLSPPNRTRIPR